MKAENNSALLQPEPALKSGAGRKQFSPEDPTVSSEGGVLPPFDVRDSAISDFGMSVRTNFEVQWGGNVEWMIVSAVAPNSSAAMQLRPEDRVIAIDQRKVTALDRDALLAALFHRKQGDRVRVLILRRGEGLPRFVTLIASRPR